MTCSVNPLLPQRDVNLGNWNMLRPLLLPRMVEVKIRPMSKYEKGINLYLVIINPFHLIDTTFLMVEIE